MRNISFALTTDQVRARTKTVTRRMGWRFLKCGDLLQAVEKCQGLKKGETVKRIAVIRVVGVREEPLSLMLEDFPYGVQECAREGFGEHPDLSNPVAFVSFFGNSHKGCRVDSVVTRIEFEYV